MAASNNKEVGDGSEIDISHQENVSQRTDAIRRNSKQHIRHRASVACYSCRDRRIRCVVPKGASECTQCKRSGTECVIRMDDERRRPISKAYVSSLSARIGMLESMLEEKGVAIPPATHPPVTRHEAQSTSSGDDSRSPASEARLRSKSDASLRHQHILSPPYSHEDFAMSESPIEDLISTTASQSRKESLQMDYSQAHRPGLEQEDLLDHLLFCDGDLSHDQLPRKLNPSSSSAPHIFTGSLSRYDVGESSGQVRRAERIIRSLTPKTYDYLMHNFWKHHNSVFQVVDRECFEADRGSERPRFYSSFLHVIMLALGWRFADKDRCDVARINVGNHESAIHREAKSMLEVDLERPTGIPSIQSLLLLGDLECGVGRDNIGWMYAGMASRLAFDMGLHIDCSTIQLSDQEVRVRRRAMKACVLYDKYWSLFQGRATSITSHHIDFDLSKATVFTTQSFGHTPYIPTGTEMVDEEIHKQFFELMSLATSNFDHRVRVGRNGGLDRSDSFPIHAADEDDSTEILLDQQLHDWYRRLPSHLSWEPENAITAPCSYFLLHKQYYAIIILLHRSRRDRRPAANEETPQASNCPKSARKICTEAALQFSSIVSQSKKRCDIGKICCTSLQPATIASIALLAAIAQCETETDRRLYHSSLEVLTDIIRDMSRSCQPAIRQGDLIEMARAQLHLNMRDPQNGYGNPWEQNGLLQFKDSNVYSSFPTNRDFCIGGQLFPAYEQPGATRPRLQPHAPPSPPYSHYPNREQLNLMSNLTPRFPDSPESFTNLGSLYSIGTDDMYSTHSVLYTSDNYLRLAPSAKGWGLHSLHAAGLVQQTSADLDSQMPDWIGESATPRHEPKIASQNGDLSVALGSELDGENIVEGKGETADSLGWMTSERRSSVFTENTELSNSSTDTIAQRRNYELDYLRL
ncbi:fungal-specific transcription factor domain-containing protein [Xylaria bambusicola]|uniref:fungal-specific transcription factor domain-containing protein n=1 Tax=Xylaria bambusicola TaxID=326684 RepID=UPI002008C226|nr:fungal-specific transcription factor domain-containing protein [Xylaria bambusicola]KAI0512942.1 fungal-specific transcription factor domain-containing protein [Xylaria bambusicola]